MTFDEAIAAIREATEEFQTQAANGHGAYADRCKRHAIRLEQALEVLEEVVTSRQTKITTTLLPDQVRSAAGELLRQDEDG